MKAEIRKEMSANFVVGDVIANTGDVICLSFENDSRSDVIGRYVAIGKRNCVVIESIFDRTETTVSLDKVKDICFVEDINVIISDQTEGGEDETIYTE